MVFSSDILFVNLLPKIPQRQSFSGKANCCKKAGGILRTRLGLLKGATTREKRGFESAAFLGLG